MASTRAGKRKRDSVEPEDESIVYDNGSDSETFAAKPRIAECKLDLRSKPAGNATLSAKSRPPFTAKPALKQSRGILDWLSPAQAPQKRTRVLAAVLIPASKDSQDASPGAELDNREPMLELSASPSAIDSMEPLKTQDSSSTSEQEMPPRPPNNKLEVPTGRGRPRRAAVRASYIAPGNASSSEDELPVISAKKLRRGRGRRPAGSDDSDFAEGAASAVEDDDDDEDDIVMEGPSDEDDSAEFDDAGEDDAAPMSAKQRGKAAAKSQVSKAVPDASTRSAYLLENKNAMKNIMSKRVMAITTMDGTLRPLSDIGEIFTDMTEKALSLGFSGRTPQEPADTRRHYVFRD